MSAIKGQFWYLDASIWQYGCWFEWEKSLQNMMIDYSVHKVSYINFIAPNRFLKILDYSFYS